VSRMRKHIATIDTVSVKSRLFQCNFRSAADVELVIARRTGVNGSEVAEPPAAIRGQ
jgi:hypothetical protein